MSLGSLVQRAHTRLGFLLARWESFEGIQIGVMDGPPCENVDFTLALVRNALALIRSVDPCRFRRIQREMDRVWVTEFECYLAEWHHCYRMCVLNLRFHQASSQRSAAKVAATIVHEATHGRLERLGFKYREDRRVAIEHVCFREEIRFARRLPDGGDVIRTAQSKLELPASTWSDAEFDKDRLEALEQLGAPEWLRRILERVARRRRKQRGLID